MKSSWVIGLSCTLAIASASAQTVASATVTPVKGQMLYDTTDRRVAPVDRVADDGSVQIIIDGKLVTVPAATLAVVDGKLTTKLTKNQVVVLH